MPVGISINTRAARVPFLAIRAEDQKLMTLADRWYFGRWIAKNFQ
jgi:hypothetical protein